MLFSNLLGIIFDIKLEETGREAKLMDQIKHKLLFLMLTLLLCAGLAACSSDSAEQGSSSAILGVWEMTEITAGARQVDAQEYKEAAGVSRVPKLTFESDGKVTLDMNGKTGNGNWTESGGNYSITYKRGEDEVTEAVDIQGSNLTMKKDGYTLTYEKQ